MTTSAFVRFDEFAPRWTSAMDSPAGPGGDLIDEAIALAEDLVAETNATGQGPEFLLIGALTHVWEVEEFSNDPGRDRVDAADALVSQMNWLVNA